MLFAILAASPAHAAGRCKLSLRPATSGLLAQIIDRITVVSATSTNAGKPCPLADGDEILHVNEHLVAGANPKDFMTYWKSLPQEAPRTYKVRRAGQVVSITTR